MLCVYCYCAIKVFVPIIYKIFIHWILEIFRYTRSKFESQLGVSNIFATTITFTFKILMAREMLLF